MQTDCELHFCSLKKYAVTEFMFTYISVQSQNIDLVFLLTLIYFSLFTVGFMEKWHSSPKSLCAPFPTGPANWPQGQSFAAYRPN